MSDTIDDDTISLVDLVAVVVRYRRLIIGGTVLAGVIAVAVLFLLPMTGIVPGPEPSYTAEVRLVVDQIPSDLREYAPIDPGVLLRAILTDPLIVGDVFEPFEEEPDPDRTRERYLATVRRTIIPERLSIAWESSTRVLTISWKANDPDDAVAFLQALYPYAADEMGRRVLRQMRDVERSLTRSLETARLTLSQTIADSVERLATSSAGLTEERILNLVQGTGTGEITAFMRAEMSLERLQTLLQNPGSLYTVVTEPVVFEDMNGQGRAVRVVVTVFAAFFLTVFLAFVLQYVRTVKSDPQEMDKLRTAWLRK